MDTSERFHSPTDPRYSATVLSGHLDETPVRDTSTPDSLVACIVHSVLSSHTHPLADNPLEGFEQNLPVAQLSVVSIRSKRIGDSEFDDDAVPILCRVTPSGEFEPLAMLLTDGVLTNIFGNSIPPVFSPPEITPPTE